MRRVSQLLTKVPPRILVWPNSFDASHFIPPISTSPSMLNMCKAVLTIRPTLSRNNLHLFFSLSPGPTLTGSHPTGSDQNGIALQGRLGVLTNVIPIPYSCYKVTLYFSALKFAIFPTWVHILSVNHKYDIPAKLVQKCHVKL